MKRLLLVIGIASFFITSLDARVRTKQSGREFDQQINKSQLLVVLFYSNNKQSGRMRSNTDQLLRMYESVSSKKLYDDADLTFVKVNVDSHNGAMIAQRYRVTTFPAFILFDNKRVVIDQEGNNAMLQGFVSAQQLNDFIQYYCGKSIQAEVEEKETRRNERIQATRDEADPYFYPAAVYSSSGDLSTWTKPLRYSPSGDEI